MLSRPCAHLHAWLVFLVLCPPMSQVSRVLSCPFFPILSLAKPSLVDHVQCKPDTLIIHTFLGTWPQLYSSR